MTEFAPAFTSELHQIQANTAWKGLEKIIPAILWRFQPGRQTALEFGVEYGYSCSVWAQLFDEVIGVDLFLGDKHQSACGPCHMQDTQRWLNNHSHVKLVQADCVDFMQRPENDRQYNLIHIDSVPHRQAAEWAVYHTRLVLCHDTEVAWVREIYEEIADRIGWKFFNYPQHHGLGILTDLEGTTRPPQVDSVLLWAKRQPVSQSLR